MTDMAMSVPSPGMIVANDTYRDQCRHSPRSPRLKNADIFDVLMLHDVHSETEEQDAVGGREGASDGGDLVVDEILGGHCGVDGIEVGRKALKGDEPVENVFKSLLRFGFLPPFLFRGI